VDPLTQGLFGSVATQQFAKKQHFILATVIGVISGMAPDLDVLIHSDTDALLALEYHRQFTHSLFFIPFGGLLCAVFFYYTLARRAGLSFKSTWLFCGLGYATHGLLDACTTYGTQLLWPFSNARFAWNTISIIDPLLTLPLLFLIIAAVIKKSTLIARLALAWIIIYSLIGVVQRERAESIGLTLAQSRGHNPIELEAKPSFANLLVWKIVYTTDQKYYVDAVKVGFSHKVYEGAYVKKLDIQEAFPWLDSNSQQAKDIERFRWFSNGYIALSPTNPKRIIDIRYSMIPNEIKGLWGIELDPSKTMNEHTEYIVNRTRDKTTVNKLWQMIIN
jgi:inner membrane protein